MPLNYHPNYAQHLYHQQQQQQQQAYGQQQPPPQQQQQQPAYGAPPPQPYGQPYAAPQPPSGPPQQWGAPAPAPSHSPPNQPHHQQYGGGRGRGGHHNSKAQPMGPPIRMGFDNGPPRDPNAPVNTGPTDPLRVKAHILLRLIKAILPRLLRLLLLAPHTNTAVDFNRMAAIMVEEGSIITATTSDSAPASMITRAVITITIITTKTPQAHHQKPDAASSGKKKKRKTNTLGLTPGDESEDDLDEEAKLSELIGSEVPQFSDITAWIEERKRNFPTQNRVKAKLATGSTSKNGDAKDERALALEKEQAKADKLRRELERVESSLKRKREQQDAGDDMRGVAASTSKSPSIKSEDDKPEVASVKQDPNANLPPPPKKADPTKHCKYYSTGGTCGKKGKCRFVHDPAVREAALKEREMNGGRMTLQQRLTLNDKDQEDLTIIKTLAYLKEKGLMEAKSASNGTAADDKTPTPSTKSSLPPPPANGLPPQPPPSVVSTPAVRYQGWNLSGFGNTGVKSDH
ncbi:hypothetical protein SLS63_008446 [Diaporthe eres]|uniref:C3H1-type domain-containing protein n=1 Tax=Diaporthe eres TaxID=83184 RepID=A0ABR1P2E8_DIAER